MDSKNLVNPRMTLRVKLLREEVYKLHDIDVNQKYDNNPYSLHLKISEKYYEKLSKFVDNMDEDYYYVGLIATILHDSIEDARLTYNDVLSLIKKHFPHQNDVFVSSIADIVYAVTNEKGKNRQERANEKYYSGIRAIPLAVLVKLADRLANMTYSCMVGGRMANLYRKEHDEFVLNLLGNNDSPLKREFQNLTNKIYELFIL